MKAYHSCRDWNGVLMTGILHLKDHFTILSYFCAIPKYTADIVGHEIYPANSLLGWPPLVSLSDNGSKFKNKTRCLSQSRLEVSDVSLFVVLRKSRGNNGHWNVGTDWQRKLSQPSSRKGVENPSWTFMMDKLHATVNGSKNHGPGGHTPYEHTFEIYHVGFPPNKLGNTTQFNVCFLACMGSVFHFHFWCCWFVLLVVVAERHFVLLKIDLCTRTPWCSAGHIPLSMQQLRC
jgi:hypothetical protein